MAPPADTRIAVTTTGFRLVADGAKPFRQYHFLLSANGSTHAVGGRFSVLEKSLRDKTDPDWSAASSAYFPSFGFFSDMIHNEANVQSRAEDLRAYLDRLLNLPDEGRLVSSAAFHTRALGLNASDAFTQVLKSIGTERRRRADAARAAAAAEQAAILKQQHDDCAFAQTFNSRLAYANMPPGGLTTITFPRPMTFELRNRMWGWGDARIKGPGGLPWFHMQRTNASLFGELFKNANFVITTMSGEPLLMLQERFRWMNYEYDLFRVDPRTHAAIPVCKIVRSWTMFAITDVYNITLFGPGIHGACPVQCAGRWPNRFTLHTNGAGAAQVNKRIFALMDTYHVEVAAGSDVLLYLGIACAIDRIHHEVEDERNRRR